MSRQSNDPLTNKAIKEPLLHRDCSEVSFAKDTGKVVRTILTPKENEPTKQ
jgi:hypothetical protein